MSVIIQSSDYFSKYIFFVWKDVPSKGFIMYTVSMVIYFSINNKLNRNIYCNKEILIKYTIYNLMYFSY